MGIQSEEWWLAADRERKQLEEMIRRSTTMTPLERDNLSAKVRMLWEFVQRAQPRQQEARPT